MEKIKVEATVDNLQTVIDFATAQLEAHDCPMKISTQLELIIEEIFVNVSSYAYYPAIGDVTITLNFVENPAAVEMTFIDGGKPYNPLETPDPDITLDVDARAIGGLGIFLVKKNSDALTYEYAGGKNILCVKKFF